MTEFLIKKCSIQDNNQKPFNFIYNRFDLWQNINQNQVQCWVYEEASKRVYFETMLENKAIHIGLWLVEMSTEVFERICSFLFSEYKFVKKILFRNLICPVKLATQHNHFNINLPNSTEELDKRLSSKGRYNIKREKRILTQDFGKYEVVSFSAANPETVAFWELYFKFKQQTYQTNYNLTPEEYCKKYHVSNIYVLLLGEERRMAAIVLSCEQCSNIFVENLTFDPELAKYSPGQILYDEYLKALINKKVDSVFLGGGDYSYKKRYHSIEQEVYSGIVYKNLFPKLLLKLKYCIKPIYRKLVARS